MRLRRHRSTIRLDTAELRALKRLYVSGGGGAEKASGEVGSIPAVSSGVVSETPHLDRLLEELRTS